MQKVLVRSEVDLVRLGAAPWPSTSIAGAPFSRAPSPILAKVLPLKIQKTVPFPFNCLLIFEAGFETIQSPLVIGCRTLAIALLLRKAKIVTFIYGDHRNLRGGSAAVVRSRPVLRLAVKDVIFPVLVHIMAASTAIYPFVP